MTKSDTPLPSASQSGETRLKARRSAFWRYVALALAGSFVVGIITGVAGGLVSDGILPAAVMIALWLLVVIGFVWGTRDYFCRIDEVDLQDNLWASTIGLYVYIMTLGSWLLFNEINVLPSPDQYVIAAITFCSVLVAYAMRKLGWR